MDVRSLVSGETEGDAGARALRASTGARRRSALAVRRARWHLAGIVALLAWTLPPFLYLVMLSIKPERILIDRSALFFVPTFERYRDFVASGLAAPIWTSLVTSTLGGLGTVVLAGLAAMTFRFLDFKAKTVLFLLILLPRMFPPVTTLIPIQLTLKALGLIDTKTALVILFIGFEIPLATWILHTSSPTCPASSPRARRSTAPRCPRSSRRSCCPSPARDCWPPSS